MTNALTNFNERIAEAISAFSAFTNEIQRLIYSIAEIEERDVHSRIVPRILNGEAALALKRLVPIDVRKEAGLFFTSNTLAEKLAARLSPVLRTGTKVLDPACGAGNLLLACARHFPLGSNLNETLTTWAEHILGYDFHWQFVLSAQIRLALLAMSMHPDERRRLAGVQPHEIFSGLKAGDVFAQSHVEQDACIAANPPFGSIPAPAGCKWATGKIQAAALFVERLLHRTAEGQHIVAILPDVLRSGTRYCRWRDMVSSFCHHLDVELAGRFDKNTDVDVFIMHAVRGNANAKKCDWPAPYAPPAEWEHKVSDFFDVRVGPVVPHRDRLRGPTHPYIHTRTAPAWQTIDILSEQRQYAGTVFSPPFVVVHRTSSPQDRHRCVATIVNEKRDTAVENHLLVLLPHDRSLQSCEQLLGVLKSSLTNEWLNSRLRCRHLTVAVIRELPCLAIGHHDQQPLATERR